MSERKISKLTSIIGIIIGVIYILNPTSGVIELIPDNLPFVGNLDEVGAVILIYKCFKNLRKGKGGVP